MEERRARVASILAMPGITKLLQHEKGLGDGAMGCQYPEALGGCSRPAIRSHSVSKSSSLRRIAEEGHVYSSLNFGKSTIYPTFLADLK